MAKEAEDAFTNLQGLKEPWVSGHGCKDGTCLQHVLEGMRNESQCWGRLMFTSFLEYIRERQCSMKDMSRSGIEETEKQVKQWKPSGARGQLEQQLLLKEVCIGRRSQELPSWTGVVSVGSPYDTDSEDVLIAARNGGDCADFQVHMQSFITYWRWHLETDSAQESSGLGDLLSTSWTACMLVWIRFAHDATLEKRLRDKWLQATTNSPNQDQLLSILTECLESPGTSHPRWSPAESCECRKEHAAGIFFTDRMVQHALRRNETRKQDWRDKVVRGWFDNIDEPALDFLIRANRFFREDMEHNSKGMSIFESLVDMT
jgi:hypothetical protein